MFCLYCFLHIKILQMSLWSHLQSFSTKPLPSTAGHLETTVPTHSTNLHCAEQGGRRRTIVFTQTHYENQQTSFSSFVSDTRANSSVSFWQKEKRVSRTSKLRTEGYRHLSQQAWVVQILQSKTAGIHREIFTFELYSEKQQTEDTQVQCPSHRIFQKAERSWIDHTWKKEKFV